MREVRYVATPKAKQDYNNDGEITSADDPFVEADDDFGFNESWQDLEDTVDKYVAITNEVNIEFSSNTVLTSLNIGQGIDIVKWLYEKVGTHTLGWFNVNPEVMPKSTSQYLNHRNLSKETKERIKKEED